MLIQTGASTHSEPMVCSIIRSTLCSVIPALHNPSSCSANAPPHRPPIPLAQESLELANQADEAFDLVEAALQKHTYFSQPPTPPPPQLSSAPSGSTSSFMPSSGMHTANNPSPSMLPTDGYDTTPGGGSLTVGMMGASVGVQVGGSAGAQINYLPWSIHLLCGAG